MHGLRRDRRSTSALVATNGACRPCGSASRLSTNTIARPPRMPDDGCRASPAAPTASRSAAKAVADQQNLHQQDGQEDRERIVDAGFDLERRADARPQAQPARMQQEEHGGRVGGGDDRARRARPRSSSRPSGHIGDRRGQRRGDSNAHRREHARRRHHVAESLETGAQAAVEQDERQRDRADHVGAAHIVELDAARARPRRPACPRAGTPATTAPRSACATRLDMMPASTRSEPSKIPMLMASSEAIRESFDWKVAHWHGNDNGAARATIAVVIGAGVRQRGRLATIACGNSVRAPSPPAAGHHAPPASGRAVRRRRGAVLGGRLRRRAPRHRRRLSPTDIAFHRFVWVGLVFLPLVARDGLADLGGVSWRTRRVADARRRAAARLVQLCRISVRAARPWRRDPAVLRRARRACAGDRGAQGEAAGAAGGRGGHHRRRARRDRRRGARHASGRAAWSAIFRSSPPV